MNIRSCLPVVPLLFLFRVGEAQQLEVVSPSTFIPGRAYPMVLEAVANGQIDQFRSEALDVLTTGGQIQNDIIKLKKGRGMATVMTNGTNSLSINGNGLSLSLNGNGNQPMQHSGPVSGPETWPSGTVHLITDHLVIEQNASVTVEAGCWVLVDSAVNIVVMGQLVASGTRSDPVVFGANSTDDWGGIIVESGTAVLSYCLLNHGGADHSQSFGHSGSQAVIKSNGGAANMDHCYIFDCVGKGIGGANGEISFSNGAISRCDMGGEFGDCHVAVTRSHVLDIPNDDGLFVDDDNDGFYFSGTHAAGPSQVDSCVFMFGKDDAIDHNGAELEVSNTWVENFEHEGIAASNTNWVTVFNSLFKNCEQGIEAGYGSPQVTVDHCVMVENDNGLRFGDWYNWGCTGSIVCTNSIMFGNLDNVYNYDVLTEGPITNAIDLSYSMANDAEYDGNTGCLTGTPIFNDAYVLDTGSIGVGQANDGLNMGLLADLSTGIPEVGSHAEDKVVSVRLFDLNGRCLSVTDDREKMRSIMADLPTGIYVIEVDHTTYLSRKKQAVIR